MRLKLARRPSEAGSGKVNYGLPNVKARATGGTKTPVLLRIYEGRC